VPDERARSRNASDRPALRESPAGYTERLPINVRDARAEDGRAATITVTAANLKNLRKGFPWSEGTAGESYRFPGVNVRSVDPVVRERRERNGRRLSIRCRWRRGAGHELNPGQGPSIARGRCRSTSGGGDSLPPARR
jgi:hypothetical protein